MADELPADVDHVIDLTTEMLDPQSIRAGGYLARPILDGTAPPDEVLAALAAEIAALDGQRYIHCAEGHGRAALVTAAVLIAEGRAETADAALAQVRAARPGIGLRATQRRALGRYADRSGPTTSPLSGGAGA